MVQIGASHATIDSPIDHLTACHRRIEQRLETLLNAAQHLGNNRTVALDAITKSLQFMDTSGALHTEDEEASIFPRLRQKLSSAEVAFIDSLEAQHAEAESIYTTLKQQALELLEAPEALPALIAHYRESAERLRSLYLAHIRTEDEILTALAKRSLDAPELAQISQEMRDRRAIASPGPHV